MQLTSHYFNPTSNSREIERQIFSYKITPTILVPH